MSQQNEELTQLLEYKGYDAHLVVPCQESAIKFFQVDNTKSGSMAGDKTVCEIRKRVEKMSTAFWKKPGKQIRRRVPLRFIRLEKIIYKVVSLLRCGLMKLKTLRELARELCHIHDEKEFLVALKSLTNFAVLFYFPEVEQLNQLVVISPQWLFNMMAAFTSVEKPDPRFLPDWRRVKSEGIMSWRLAVHLLKLHGVQEDDCGGVLQFLRLIGTISPRQDEPSDVMARIEAGRELFVPSLMEESRPFTGRRESEGMVDSPSPHLPPSLVFYPKNVDLFPEVLFFRFIAFLLSRFPVKPQLRRSCYVFNIGHDLQLKVVYHACYYVTVTLLSVSRNVDHSTIAPFCSQLYQMMCEQLGKARFPGMPGFQFDMCVHIANDSPISRIQSDNLVLVSDYKLHGPLVRRNGQPISSSECPTLAIWFASSSFEMQGLLNEKPIATVVLKHGASRWYAIGRALGYSKDELTTMTSGVHVDSDKLLVIIDAKSTSLGHSKAMEGLLQACKDIDRPIFKIVENELKA